MTIKVVHEFCNLVPLAGPCCKRAWPMLWESRAAWEPCLCCELACLCYERVCSWLQESRDRLAESLARAAREARQLERGERSRPVQQESGSRAHFSVGLRKWWPCCTRAGSVRITVALLARQQGPYHRPQRVRAGPTGIWRRNSFSETAAHTIL